MLEKWMEDRLRRVQHKPGAAKHRAAPSLIYGCLQIIVTVPPTRLAAHLVL